MPRQQSTDNIIPKTFTNRYASQDIKKEKYSVTLNQVPIPCCKIGTDTIINDCNEPFATLFGSSRIELIQTSFLDLVDPSSYRVIEKILAADREDNFSSSNSHSQAIWFKRNNDNNTIFPCTLYVNPIDDNHGRIIGYIMVIVDETLNRRTIEMLEKDRHELKKKERLQDEFIAVASHELRTPIQPILGFAFLAKKGLLSEDKAWDGVLEEARKLQQIANDILDVSRIDSGSLIYEMRNEKINHLLVSITDSVRNELQNKNVSIVTAYDEADADFEIEADRARITQMVNNIVGNAVKFTEKGTIRVESKAFPDRNKFEIRISDTGKGISEEIMPRLFEKFVTKGHGNIQNNKGTGLGLYICKAIVKAHSGEISAFNNKDGGATFLIVLPISRHQNKEILK